MSEYKKFLVLCIVFSMILCTSLFCNYIFIIHAYENLSYKEIVETQLKTKAIWGSALNPHAVSYKYELYKHRKPDITTLGSSISFEFRHEFFTSTFTNCGGVVPFLHWGTVFLQEILKFHKPKVLILTIDFCQFNDRYQKCHADPSFADSGADYLIYKLRQPFVWLWEGKLSLADYFNILLFKNNRNGITKYNNMGILAIKRSEGFRDDGSYSYAWLVSGFHQGFYDKKFATSLKHVEEGAEQFLYGDSLASDAVNELNEIIKICGQQDIKLVIILPPVAPTVFRKMQTKPGAYKFLDNLRQYVRSLPVEAYDFLTNHYVSFSDGEFIDGYHPGDVVDQKMLLAIIKLNPHSVLRDYLNIDFLQQSVKQNAGRAMSVYDRSRYNFNEVDFLEIGCPK